MDFTNLLNDAGTMILSAVLLISFIALCLYYGLVWLRVAKFKDSKVPKGSEVADKDLPSVSVVIVAHNEAEALKRSLPYLLEQEYPDFEVVVVDYTSQDDTPFVLRVCGENYPNLKAVLFPHDVNMFQGKKYPLSIGIKSAKKDIILLTEPDCVPKDFGWIREMMCGYMHGASMVLGYCAVEKRSGLLNAMQQYDNVIFSTSYLGSAMMGSPYTGSGRNLSYKRDFFFNRGAFISHYHFPEGADDLFVNQNSNKSNTAVVFRDKALVIREGSKTFRLWRRERIERFSSQKHYGLKDKLRLGVYPLSQILFLATLLWLWIAALLPWELLAGVLALRVIWETVSFLLLAKRFDIKKLQFFVIFFELYFLFSNTFLRIVSLRKKKKQWR